MSQPKPQNMSESVQNDNVDVCGLESPEKPLNLVNPAAPHGFAKLTEDQRNLNLLSNVAETSLTAQSIANQQQSPPLSFDSSSESVEKHLELMSSDKSGEFHDEDDESSPMNAAVRREKSLGLLCQKFLTCMMEQAVLGKNIHLESTAANLHVEKRRVYDIVNVMEALEAMEKRTKSYYAWFGLSHLPTLMYNLKKEAENEGLPARILEIEKLMCHFTELSKNKRERRNSKDFTKPGDRVLVGSTLSTTPSASQDSGYWSVNGSQENIAQASTETTRDSMDSPLLIDVIEFETDDFGNEIPKNRRDSSGLSKPRDRTGRNSLSILCRRFLMILLCAPGQLESTMISNNAQSNNRVSLDVASTLLIKDPSESGSFQVPSRSKCRRLYDIANVLVAMGIIKKVHYLFGTKKIPLFEYCGPAPAKEKMPRSTSEWTLPMQLPKLDKENAMNLTAGGGPKGGAPLRKQPSLMDIAEIAAHERNRLGNQTLPATPIGSENVYKSESLEEQPLNLAKVKRIPLSPKKSVNIVAPIQSDRRPAHIKPAQAPAAGPKIVPKLMPHQAMSLQAYQKRLSEALPRGMPISIRPNLAAQSVVSSNGLFSSIVDAAYATANNMNSATALSQALQQQQQRMPFALRVGQTVHHPYAAPTATISGYPPSYLANPQGFPYRVLVANSGMPFTVATPTPTTGDQSATACSTPIGGPTPTVVFKRSAGSSFQTLAKGPEAKRIKTEIAVSHSG